MNLESSDLCRYWKIRINRNLQPLTISDLKSNFIHALSDIYPPEEIESFFNILAQEFLNLSRIQIALDREQLVSAKNIDEVEKAIARLKMLEPIQYIVGNTEFFGLTLKVSPSTLIPRPETEELVQYIIDDVSRLENKTDPVELLDIGTGSGCIAISLAKNLRNSKVSAMDVSSAALKIAHENARDNKVNITLLEQDVLLSETLPEKYDIIVSNPPYVRELEKEWMQPNVLKHEPELALFVKDSDPLIFYRKIAELSRDSLKPNGKLFFEINEYLGEEMTELLVGLGFRDIEIKKDIFEKDRMLKCRL